MLYRANDVSSAVKMAEDMKRRGTHDWFRGQTRNWTLQSSLNRNPARFDESLLRVKRFSAWVKSTPGLEQLSHDVDATLAVAQHYGLPTHFIDFTTEPYVAGYFASENAPTTDPAAFDLSEEERRFFASQPATDQVGCILCLNREVLLDTWRTVASVRPVQPDAAPEFLVTQVPDLWRLEAQHGVFFYCPIARFEEIVYDLDRIVFPHCGQIAWPPRELIYPERKSHLEVQLDQYFLLERLTALKQAQREAGLDKVPAYRFQMNAARTQNIPIHPSWERAALQQYVSPAPSSFFASLSEERWPVEVSLTSPPQAVGDTVKEHVLARLQARPTARNELVRWHSGSPAFDSAATLVWDGLRGLPCADEDLAIAIGNCAGLCCAKAQAPDQDGLSVSAAYYQSDALEVEFSTQERGFSRSYISKRSLLQAFRDDLQQFLDPAKLAWLLDNPGFILLEVLAPNRMFPFARFERLFLHEVVPSQAVWWSEIGVIFSPARIVVFGLP
jgi:hypothetical protein